MKLDNYSMGFTSKEAFKNKLIEVIDKADNNTSITLIKRTVDDNGEIKEQTFGLI